VQLQQGRRLFVKLYDVVDGFQTEQEVLRLLGESHSELFIIPAERSDITEGVPWIAFPWIDLDPVHFDLQTARSFGQLMAQLHRAPLSAALERIAHPIDLVAARLARLSVFPEIYERTTRLWERVSASVQQEIRAYATPPVLLQNDFGARNIFKQRARGQFIVIDFERAGAGNAHWELGKLWDRELYPDSPIRARFLEGYHEARASAADVWPHPPTLWLTRFVATLAIFPYATQVGDTEFFQHGLFKLDIIEAEAAQWR
jgi:aminoglycoside phosphotransferase (APT) family kinase protein